MNYKKFTNIDGETDVVIIRIEDSSGNPDRAFIPVNEKNTDYQDYLKWVDEGNTPEPADE
tara:strand:- start:30 stop:209 length:180 start_codon:yes stop_codon:yes gene_type:complete